MKNSFKAILTVIIVSSFIGCSSNLRTANGGYSDLSLTRDSEGYTIKRIPEISRTGTAFWGIPKKQIKEQDGIIFRFNGITLNRSKRFLPTLTLIGMTAVGAVGLPILSFREDEIALYAIGAVASLPIAGTINNIIWSNSAYQYAAYNINHKLITENPEIDVFLNPKYEIKRRNSLWKQETTIKLNVLGAKIIEDNIVNSKSNQNHTYVKEESVTLEQSQTEEVTITQNVHVNQNVPVQPPTTITIPESKSTTTAKSTEIISIADDKGFKIGDIVTFNETIVNRGITMDLTIRNGEIIAIKNNKYTISYEFDNRKKKTTKAYSEITKTAQ
ncbi:MAG: hypothetical protein LWX70_15775 [Sphingobacteriia bacterium]|nr:hypothetical protein [Sphingobacteriia bacterium]OJX83330.1 MAG: hypothetical protein BGP01_03245 [Paludibacter sp. 47-17]